MKLNTFHTVYLETTGYGYYVCFYTSIFTKCKCLQYQIISFLNHFYFIYISLENLINKKNAEN